MDDINDNLLHWFIHTLGQTTSKAESNYRIFANEDIETLSQLMILLEEDPNFMNQLNGLSAMTQAMIRSKIFAMHHTKLAELSLNAVRVLISNIFPDRIEYSESFYRREINGFVLNSVSNALTLMEWGEMSQIHAEALWFHLKSWKEKGVHHTKLIDADIAQRTQFDSSGYSLGSLLVKREVVDSRASSSDAEMRSISVKEEHAQQPARKKSKHRYVPEPTLATSSTSDVPPVALTSPTYNTHERENPQEHVSNADEMDVDTIAHTSAPAAPRDSAHQQETYASTDEDPEAMSLLQSTRQFLLDPPQPIAASTQSPEASTMVVADVNRASPMIAVQLTPSVLPSPAPTASPIPSATKETDRTHDALRLQLSTRTVLLPRIVHRSTKRDLKNIRQAADRPVVATAVHQVSVASPPVLAHKKPSFPTHSPKTVRPVPPVGHVQGEEEAEWDEHTAFSASSAGSPNNNQSGGRSGGGRSSSAHQQSKGKSHAQSPSSDEGLSDTDSDSDAERNYRGKSKLLPKNLQRGAAAGSPGVAAPVPSKPKSADGANKLPREVLALYKETNPPPRSKPKPTTTITTSSSSSSSKVILPTASAASSASAATQALKKSEAVPKSFGGNGEKTQKVVEIDLNKNNVGKEKVKENECGTNKGRSTATCIEECANLLQAAADEDDQVEALSALIRHAVNKKDLGVIEFNRVGIIDRLFELLNNPLSEFILWKGLVLLNNIICFEKGAEFCLAPERGLIEIVISLFASPSKRVRIQALWIVSNASVNAKPELEARVIMENMVNGIVESYHSLDTMEQTIGKVEENPRRRFAETILVLLTGRDPQYVPLLDRFVPVLAHIFQHESDVEATQHVTSALQLLLSEKRPSTLAALRRAQVVPRLVDVVAQAASGDETLKISKVQSALELLISFGELREKDATAHVLGSAVKPLTQLIIGTPGIQSKKKLLSLALTCLSVICEAGDADSIRYVLQSAHALVDKLSENINSFNDRASTRVSISQASAEILLCVAHFDKSDATIAGLLDRGFYATLFKIIEVFENDPEMTEQALKILTWYIVKVENIVAYQQNEERVNESFRAEEVWSVVKNLARSSASSTVVRNAASALYAQGREQGLVKKKVVA